MHIIKHTTTTSTTTNTTTTTTTTTTPTATAGRVKQNICPAREKMPLVHLDESRSELTRYIGMLRPATPCHAMLCHAMLCYASRHAGAGAGAGAGAAAGAAAAAAGLPGEPQHRSACLALPARSPACLPTYLPACLSACLPASLPACPSVCLPATSSPMYLICTCPEHMHHPVPICSRICALPPGNMDGWMDGWGWAA